jgi:hypothetical protein
MKPRPYRHGPDLLGGIVRAVRWFRAPRDRRLQIRLGSIDLATARQLDAPVAHHYVHWNTQLLEEDRMRPVRLLLLAVAVLALATPAAAQVVLNPTRVAIQGTYTDTEYASITEFRLAYYAIPATPDGRSCVETAPLPSQPVQITVMPKPATWAGGEAEGPLPSRPYGCYRMKAQAVANGLVSEFTVGTSTPFAVPPAIPSVVVR